ncbi:MAG: hypothetical protein GOVbin2277_17 [Prokaryotic dsDNA virus sp.]|jgi:hypothetical protein|nr:MAG: hypothetical protein GOVbin2277_17 [Prokaryotic dsDNA virus sp.]
MYTSALAAGVEGAVKSLRDDTEPAGSVKGTARGSGPDYSSGLYDSYRYSYGANPPMKVRERETQPLKSKRDKLLDAFRARQVASAVSGLGNSVV